MSRGHRESFVAIVSLFLALVLLCSTSHNAGAKAWVLPKGSCTISLMHQRLYNTGHRRIGGLLAEVGQSTNTALYVEGEYALTDRLSVSAGIPYVFAKYTARNLPP